MESCAAMIEDAYDRLTALQEKLDLLGRHL